MGFIRQPVPYWHSSIAGKFFHLCLFVSAILDPVIHTAEDASGILHGLFVANMRAAWADVGDVSTLVECGDLKSAARSRRVLLEDERNLLAFQVLHFCSCIFGCFQFSCQLQEKTDLLLCKVIQLQEM